MDGQDGTDLFYGSDGSIDTVDGGLGVDTVANSDDNDVLLNI